MIQTIHAQLSAWGRWVVKTEVHKVGYPNHSAGFGDYLPVGVEYKSRPPAGIFTGQDAMLSINSAVQSLSNPDRALCAEYYVVGPNWESVCARLAMSKSVLYRELHRIQDRVSMILCEGI